MIPRTLLALSVVLAALPARAETQTAIFAGGCFWCVESDMDHVKGVTDTVSGYAGGTMANPTYEDHEGYQEAVRVTFDDSVTSYADLVAIFLRTIDVTDPGGQFCDRGSSYTTGVYVNSAAQRSAAEAAVQDGEKQLGAKIVTPVRDATAFTPAEDYHQDYYLGQNRVLTRFGYIKQAKAYKNYREGCGRDARVRQVWGDQAYRGVDHSM